MRWRRRKIRSEQATPINWEAIARQRERELRAAGEARHAAETERDVLKTALMRIAALHQVGHDPCDEHDAEFRSIPCETQRLAAFDHPAPAPPKGDTP